MVPKSVVHQLIMVVYYIPIIYNRVLYIQAVLVQYVDTSRVHFFGTFATTTAALFSSPLPILKKLSPKNRKKDMAGGMVMKSKKSVQKYAVLKGNLVLLLKKNHKM